MTQAFTLTPPQRVVNRAQLVAAQQPPGRCRKSLRGAVVFCPMTGRIIGRGYNAPPSPFACTGTPRCREVCRRICEHAEARAIRDADLSGIAGGRPAGGWHILHVKLGDNGMVTPSGPPSCADCSKMILGCGFIAGVWLFETIEPTSQDAEGPDVWRFYTAEDFHRRSLLAEYLYEEP